MQTQQSLLEEMDAHLNAELYSSYLYLAMSAHFESVNMPGMARWMRRQSEEEYEHGMKFFDFLHDRGGRVQLRAIAQPPVQFQSPLDIFQQALAHEQEVTRKINHLYGRALEERDYAAQVFLQWFVSEQVEEEKTATQIVETLRAVGDDKIGLLMVDRELGGRRGSMAVPSTPAS